MRRLAGSQVRFNYLGQIQMGKGDGMDGAELFRVAKERSGVTVARRNRRSYVFDITAHITARTLQINWNYATRLHRGVMIRRLATRFLHHLCALLQTDMNRAQSAYAPSDFPLAQLNQSQLDAVAETLRRLEGTRG
jgi:non-ribosomal peptide synthase protein (TIGR01720 family)